MVVKWRKLMGGLGVHVLMVAALHPSKNTKTECEDGAWKIWQHGETVVDVYGRFPTVVGCQEVGLR
jgi:hypothetical protein